MKKTWRQRSLSIIACIAMLFGTIQFSGIVNASDNEAMIAETPYATLKEAMAAAKDNDTIKLLKNVETTYLEVSKHYTLDLNQKKLTITSSEKSTALKVSGSLTITGNGTLSKTQYGYLIDISGTLNIVNGTYRDECMDDKEHNGENNAALIRNLGTLTIANGDFKDDGIVIKNDDTTTENYGTLTINNGTFTGRNDSKSHANIQNSGIATINNGVFNGGNSTVMTYASTLKPVTTINGGTFTAGASLKALSNYFSNTHTSSTTVNIINGGIFHGSFDPLDIQLATGSGQAVVDTKISGGVYDNTFNTGLASGFGCYAKDGKYVVTPTPSGIALSKSALSIKEGDSATLNATIAPSTSAAKAEWSSSDDTIASVKDGVITAKKTGIATITVKAGDKTTNATITVFKMTTPTIPPAVDGSKPVDEVTIGIGKETTTNISKTMDAIIDALNNKKAPDGINKATADKLKTAIASGKTVTSALQSNNLTEKEVAKTDVAKIKAVMDEHATIAQYLDLEVLLKADGETLGNITAFEDKLTFTVAVPEDLKVEGRTFYVIRLHDGVVDKLNTTLNKDGTLSFETDRLSIYAIVYEDNRDTTGVNTGDTTSMILPIMFMMASCTLMGIVVILKKKQAMLK